MKLIVSGTGTDAGKTCVGRGLANAWRLDGHRVAALKPMETGVGDAGPLDAQALQHAARMSAPGAEGAFYRASEPLSPFAVALETGKAPPDGATLAFHVKRLAADVDQALVEGAGGLLVPLDGTTTTLDFFCELSWPVLLVARDQLGVQSDVLAYAAQLRSVGLSLAAVVLTRFPGGPATGGPAPSDPSPGDQCRSVSSNQQVIGAMGLGAPVLVADFGAFDDAGCETAVRRSGLLSCLAEPYRPV